MLSAPVLQPFHRTLSLDYALVVKGTVTCVLDDDKRVTLRPGDVLVQRGTIHAWVVEGDEWARLFFCLLRKSIYRLPLCALPPANSLQPQGKSRRESASSTPSSTHSPMLLE